MASSEISRHEDEMIVSHVSNGLGNQLFQYAAGRSLAHHNKVDLALDARSFANNASRVFMLDRFNIKVAPLGEDQLPPLREQHRLKYIAWKRLGIGGFRRFIEKGMHFNEGFFANGPDTFISGGWQSELYFNNIGEIIRSELSVRTPPNPENAQVIEKISKNPSVSVHVRRGDYCANRAAPVDLGTCSSDYYQQAAQLIAQKNNIDPVFYVFSDEIDWAKENLHLPFETSYVAINDANSAPQEDIRLMARCDHHIIANSTFSWWGAWLNPSKEKIVIAPKRWFAQEHLQNRDIIPTNWLRL